MPQIEASLPDHIDSEIDHLVEQGEFINRDQAVEELLTLGVSAYDREEDTASELDDDLFTNVVDEQQDPAMQTESNDEPTF